MSKFIHLHVHSHFSLLDGLSKIDDILDRAEELKMDAIALTDHGVIYGAVEFYEKAKKRGIKPILGCEIYEALKSMDEKKSKEDSRRSHLLLLIKNEKGYNNLVKIITEAHLRGFYYKPRIDLELLKKHSEGLIGLSACLQGRIPQLLLAGKIQEAEELALKYQDIFGKGNFFLEIQPHFNLEDQIKSNKLIIELSKKTGIPLVATNDSHYCRKDDAEAQDILMLINTGADKNDRERLSMKGDDFSLKSEEEMIESFKDVPEAIENTLKIRDLCNFEMKLGEIKLPKFDVPEGKTNDEYLRELCIQGINKKYKVDEQELENYKKGNKEVKDEKLKEIIDRMEYELNVISKTGFSDYFLIVQDFVNWAKSNRIVVGPGRGSAGGSIVAYLTNITNVDPLKYNLYFQRFLNPDRISPPDIDLDFTDKRRDEVINYVAEKYGRNRVAQIITFGTMAARAAIRDVGRALDYEYSYCDKIAKMIPVGFNLQESLERVPEFRSLYETDERAEKLVDLALKIEGCARHASTHACGVVISKFPLDNLVPLQHPTQDENAIVTQYEMHAIENMGLLKMDFLGLKNLTTIEETLKRIYAVRGNNLDIEKIPLDDKKTFDLLKKGDCIALFQLESDGMRRYLKQLKPTEIDDIIAMVALYRPGPMQHIPDYIKGKHNQKEIRYIHPKLKPILESTYGIPLYQEQIMRIAQEMAGFTLAEADILRKAIGKKIEKLLMEQKEKFVKGMKENQISEKIAEEIWHWIEPFARYSFNKSHAACYAIIAYETAYLKANYPVEYMAAVLTSEGSDVERIALLIEECNKMKLEVLPPDINESFSNFSVVPNKNQIRFGLTAIKNVGYNIVEQIIDERKKNGPFISIQDFMSRVNGKVLNKKSLESLIKAGVFDNLEERNKILHNLEKLLQWSKDDKRIRESGQKGLFSSMPTHNHINLESAEAINEYDKLNWEKELLGLYISGHPLEKHKEMLNNMTTPIKKINTDLGTYIPRSPFERYILQGEVVTIGGIISSIKKIITKKGQVMMFVKVEDLTDRIEVVVFPSMIEKNPEVFKENKIISITGRTDVKDGSPKIIANEIEEILES
ncbi:MAG TPA: DNA polymerase III subunit alpha [Candidatus Pacearchaeota archaeon]|nr:DNA polymerase III subunit alpha [Candidatus Pacearchaeota archaeon]HQM24380.1 DNA polymerase III subunit alpha [Candidatus Pacearchaeota archaeon]